MAQTFDFFASAKNSRRFGEVQRSKNMFTYFYKQTEEALADVLSSRSLLTSLSERKSKATSFQNKNPQPSWSEKQSSINIPDREDPRGAEKAACAVGSARPVLLSPPHGGESRILTLPTQGSR